MFDNDVPKYRKKKSNSSRSEKRADHKHDYQRVIVGNRLGSGAWHWSKRCSVCGRFGLDKTMTNEFLKPNTFDNVWRLFAYLSLDEVRQKYPDTPIYKFDYMTDKYTLIEREEE